MQQGSSGTFRDVALRGILSIGAAQACRAALQFASLFALSRILAPLDFGIVAMVMPVVALVTLVQDFGIQQALVQAREIGAAQINRLFWVNVAGTLLVVSILVLVAPSIAGFYGDPRVAPLIASWTLPLALTSLASHHLALLTRALRFRDLARVDLAAAAATAISVIGAALLLRSYWAIWASATVGAAVTLATSWYLSGWRPGLPWARADAGHLIRFGSHVMGSNIMNFLARNLDNVIIARAFGPVQLGLYDLSYKILLLPISQINAPVGRVMQPILGRLREDAARYRASYLTVACATTWTMVPAISALAISAQDVVLLFFGERWAGAAPILAWLGLAGVCQPLANTTGWLFVTQHRTREMFRWSLFSGATSIASFFVGLAWGVAGIAAAYALSSLLLRTPLLFLVVGRHGPVSAKDLAGVALPPLIAAALSFVVFAFIGARIDMSPLTGVAAAVALSYGLLAALLVTVPGSRGRLLVLTRAAADFVRPTAAPGLDGRAS